MIYVALIFFGLGLFVWLDWLRLVREDRRILDRIQKLLYLQKGYRDIEDLEEDD